MTWVPRKLKLTSINPTNGKTGQGSVELALRGEGFAPGIQAVFVRSVDRTGSGLLASDVIVSESLEIIEGQYLMKAKVFFDAGIAPGAYDVVIWNPSLSTDAPSERYVLESALIVTTEA